MEPDFRDLVERLVKQLDFDNDIDDNIIEGDFTDEKTPPAPETPPAPKERTPAEQKILDDLKAKQDAEIKKRAAEVAQKEAEAKQIEANTKIPTSLKDGETVTVTAEIIDIASMMGKYKGEPTPLVQAQLINGFTGLVMHFGGGELKGKEVAPDPLYKLGAVRKFTIKATKNNLSGKIVNMVEKIEVGEAAPDTATEMA